MGPWFWGECIPQDAARKTGRFPAAGLLHAGWPARDMTLKKSRSLFHFAYLATLAIKGLDGAIEIAIGLLIGLAGPDRIYEWIIRVTEPGMELHPHAFGFLRAGAGKLTDAHENFVVFYLLVHGILKLGIAIELIRDKSQWIYPVATTILCGFIIYMGSHLLLHWSGWVLGFALFDLFTVALVINEWVNHKPRHRSRST